MSEELKQEITQKASSAGKLDKKAGYRCRPFNSTRYQALEAQYPQYKTILFQSYVDGFEGKQPDLNTRIPFPDEF
jgi:hypothetical protein